MTDTPSTCTWVQDDEDSSCYDTECKQSFDVNDSISIPQNDFKFCCYCGKSLRSETWEEVGDD